MDKTSIKTRFISTVVANMLKMIFAFVTGLVIARILGPSDYGNYYFLLGSFTALAALVNMATSSAFYTFISQKRRGPTFFLYYSLWIILQFLILLVLILVLPTTLKARIWLGHSRDLIFFALAASFMMNQIWGYLGRIGESIRDTVTVQIRNIALAVTYLIVVIVVASLHLLDLKTLFLINIVLYLIYTFWYGWRLYKTNIFFEKIPEKASSMFREFRIYCQPLIIYTILAFLYQFADYWLLQKFGGSIEQGYYAIGAKFATVSLIATTSILQVLWKEVAEAKAQGNMEKVRRLYQTILHSLFFISALCSCILIPFSEDLLVFLLGPSYQAAWLALAIMLFYPLHQSIGQITGTMLLALERTKLKSYLGIFFMGFSIVITYFVLAPKNFALPGLNLGAIGLSLKMVLCNLVVANLTAYFVAKVLKVKFTWLHQIKVVLILVPLGFIVKEISVFLLNLLPVTVLFIPIIILATILYLGIITLIVYYFPGIAGISRNNINQGLSWLRQKFNIKPAN